MIGYATIVFLVFVLFSKFQPKMQLPAAQTRKIVLPKHVDTNSVIFCNEDAFHMMECSKETTYSTKLVLCKVNLHEQNFVLEKQIISQVYNFYSDGGSDPKYCVHQRCIPNGFEFLAYNKNTMSRIQWFFNGAKKAIHSVWYSVVTRFK